MGVVHKLCSHIWGFRVREAPFWNVLVLYGHYPNSFRLPPSVKRAIVEKKCSKPSSQALTPPGKRGKKVGLTILASLYTHTLSGYAHGNNTFQGASLIINHDDEHCLQIAQQEYMFLNCGITFKRHFQEAQIVMSLTGCPNVLK